jgi:hypothetical protein
MADTNEKIILRVEFDQSDAIKKVAALQGDINKLTQANKELAKSVGTDNAAYQENARLIKNLSDQQRALNKNIDASIAAFDMQEGSMMSLQKNLYLATDAYKRMTKAERESAEGMELKTKIAATSEELYKLEAELNDHRRNVGNYSSAYNGLGNAMSQLSREAPAFANSVSTGFMAISNNLPILFDEMSKIKEANKELAKEGKSTQSVLSQVAGSLFSWQTLLSVGVTLLTIYGKEIINFIGQMIKGSESIDVAKESLSAFSNALNDNSVKDGIKNFYEVQNNINLAKQGLADKSKVLEDYNSKIGSTVGYAKDLNEAEKLMVDSKTKYIDSIIQKAAANNLLVKSAELTIQKAKLEAGEIGLVDILLYGAKNLTGKSSDAAIAVVNRHKQEIENITKQINDINKVAMGMLEKSTLNVGKSPEQVKDENDKLKNAYYENQKNKIDATLYGMEKEFALLDLDKQKELDTAVEKGLNKVYIEQKYERIKFDMMQEEAAKYQDLIAKNAQIIADIELKLAENKVAAAKKAFDETSKNADKEVQEILKNMDTKAKIAILEADSENERLLAKEELIEAEYQAKLESLRKQNAASEDFVLAELERNNKLKAINQQRVDSAIQVGQALGQLISQAITDSEMSLEKFSKAIITMALDTLGKLAIAAIAQTTLQQVATMGFAGLIQAAILSGIITAAVETAKTGISRAAGGGSFMTNGPTMLLVGDNPGGQERVDVTPISGKGQTYINPHSGMLALAGGGTVITNNNNYGGYSERNGTERDLIDYDKLARALGKTKISVDVDEINNKNKVKVQVTSLSSI